MVSGCVYIGTPLSTCLHLSKKRSRLGVDPWSFAIYIFEDRFHHDRGARPPSPTPNPDSQLSGDPDGARMSVLHVCPIGHFDELCPGKRILKVRDPPRRGTSLPKLPLPDL